jgi:hypothetical protein
MAKDMPDGEAAVRSKIADLPVFLTGLDAPTEARVAAIVARAAS